MGEDAAGGSAPEKEIPGAGWRRILIGTVQRANRDRIDIVASSAAFWALLALFPAMAAVLAMSTYVIDPVAMQAQIAALIAPLPQEAGAVVNETAAEVASRGGAVGVGAIVAIGFAIWTASAATKTLMEGLNNAHEVRERRGFFRFNAVALLLTFGMFVGFILSVVAIVVIPATLAHQPGLGWAASLVDWLRWPVMAIFAMVGLATLYRFGPSRRNAKWRWVSFGAVVATVLWMLVSLGFSLYVSKFAAYNKFYGTLGGIAVLMIWFWLSAGIALVGAELNSEIEAQHRRDMSVNRSRFRATLRSLRAAAARRLP